MTMKKSITLAASVAALLVSVGCSSSSSSSSASKVSGVVYDAYAKDCNITVAGTQVARTGALGLYEFFEFGLPAISATGCIDTASNLPLPTMQTPAGQTTISPVSTLVVAGASEADLAKAFGLEVSDLYIDPLADSTADLNKSKNLLKAAVKISTIVRAATETMKSVDGTVNVETITNTVNNQIKEAITGAAVTVDFSPAMISTIVKKSADKTFESNNTLKATAKLVVDEVSVKIAATVKASDDGINSVTTNVSDISKQIGGTQLSTQSNILSTIVTEANTAKLTVENQTDIDAFVETLNSKQASEEALVVKEVELAVAKASGQDVTEIEADINKTISENNLTSPSDLEVEVTKAETNLKDSVTDAENIINENEAFAEQEKQLVADCEAAGGAWNGSECKLPNGDVATGTGSSNTAGLQ